MDVSIIVGDLFECSGDVLICPANPWLNMSGGVNGEILLRCGPAIQSELHQHLETKGTKQVSPGTAVVTKANGLDFKNIVHAVAIDVFYDTSIEIVTTTLQAAWKKAKALGTTVVMPTLATGYGRLPFEDFSRAFSNAITLCNSIDLQLTLVVRTEQQNETITSKLST